MGGGFGGGPTAMCIYSGPLNSGASMQTNPNPNRLRWMNVRVTQNMSFEGLLDAACAQMGLLPPTPTSTAVLGNQGVFGAASRTTQRYVVRNQMGHKCELQQSVREYLRK